MSTPQRHVVVGLATLDAWPAFFLTLRPEEPRKG
jgi:hypothetical protein